MALQKSSYQAYSLATRTVPKIGQVVILFDGAIRFIRQAKEAIAEKRIEDRFKLLLRASKIIVGLRSSLDYEKGGEVAKTLEAFYTNMDVRILSINFAKEGGEALCEQVISDLKVMRDVWADIDSKFSSGNTEESSSGVAAAQAASGNSGVTLSA